MSPLKAGGQNAINISIVTWEGGFKKIILARKMALTDPGVCIVSLPVMNNGSSVFFLT